MRFVLITVSKIPSSIITELKKNYSIIHFDEKLHIQKDIQTIGESEIVVVDLKLSLLKSVQNNNVLKWLNSQELTEYKSIYVYGKIKHKSLFSKADIYIKSLPVIIGKTLYETLNIATSMSDGSCSISRDELKCINQSIEEHDPMIDADRFISLLQDYKRVRDDLKEMTRRYTELKRGVKDEPPVKIDNIMESLPDKPLTKAVRTIQLITGGIRLIEDGKEVKFLSYKNNSDRRKARINALRWKDRLD